ncbi:hypothetical protein HQ520_13695, partial [bacterium]|nr:hypothetical protein [bacterium]
MYLERDLLPAIGYAGAGLAEVRPEVDPILWKVKQAGKPALGVRCLRRAGESRTETHAQAAAILGQAGVVAPRVVARNVPSPLLKKHDLD